MCYMNVKLKENKVEFAVSMHTLWFDCKWFEPRSISRSYGVIVRVRVVLKRTVAGD